MKEAERERERERESPHVWCAKGRDYLFKGGVPDVFDTCSVVCSAMCSVCLLVFIALGSEDSGLGSNLPPRPPRWPDSELRTVVLLVLVLRFAAKTPASYFYGQRRGLPPRRGLRASARPGAATVLAKVTGVIVTARGKNAHFPPIPGLLFPTFRHIVLILRILCKER